MICNGKLEMETEMQIEMELKMKDEALSAKRVEQERQEQEAARNKNRLDAWFARVMHDVLQEEQDTWERQWNEFCKLAKVKGQIQHRDIPWVPVGSSVAGVLHTDSAIERKRKIHSAMRRWHPDKFFAQFGHMLCPRDHAKIVIDVDNMAKRLNSEVSN
eukprot:gene3648-4583_t